MTKGPFTQVRDEIAVKYQFKAETIVRWFETLDMTRDEKVKYLRNEFAGLEMYLTANYGVSTTSLTTSLEKK